MSLAKEAKNAVSGVNRRLLTAAGTGSDTKRRIALRLASPVGTKASRSKYWSNVLSSGVVPHLQGEPYSGTVKSLAEHVRGL